MKTHHALWLLLLATGCSKLTSATPSPNEAAEKPAAPSIRTVRPEKKAIRREIEQPGHVEAFAQTPIHVKIAGSVKEVLVDIGDPVNEGQKLAELSVPEMDEELEYKRRLVSLSDAEIKQARETLNAA